MINFFAVYIDFNLSESHIKRTQNCTTVSISLAFRAETKNLVYFLQKIEKFWFCPRKTAYFYQFGKNPNMIGVLNYRPHVVQKWTFEKNI